MEYKWKGSFLDWFIGRVGTRYFYPALVALVSPVQIICFLTAHFFTLGVSIAQKPRQAVVPRRLSLNMCLWLYHGQSEGDDLQDKW